MLFGRCFEQALAALFRREDPAVVLFEQWAPCKNLELTYSGNETWDHMFHQGIQLLERFTQDAFKFSSHVAINRSDSRGRCLLATALSPSSVLSENWTTQLVSWSGRPAPPDIRTSLTALRH